ncbi:hypothetical protein BKA82DRAFT_2459587 [Pisolithus tinctorius]|nr:hypothetical protein BKA82DRAFT_2459587 [Pisolithus tinctorius]
MARRIFRCRKPSGSASNSVSSQGGVALNAATSGSVTRMPLARMRRIFRRSNQGPIAAQTADTGAGGGAQEQPEQSQAAPTQETQRPAHGSETLPAAHDVDTVVGPSGDTSEGAVGPASGASTTLDPVSALVRSGVDDAQQTLDRMTPMPGVGQSATKLVAQADTAATNIQNFSNTYLQPLKTFNSVITSLANVHPYAQIALGILTAAAQRCGRPP